MMRYTLKMIPIAGFVLLSLLTPARGGELMLRLACVGNQVMDQYRIKTGGFFSRHAVYPGLLEALHGGSGALEDGSAGTGEYIPGHAVLDKLLGDADQEIQDLLPFGGRIIGRQEGNGGSGWKKVIVASGSPPDPPGCLVMIGGQYASGHDRISHIAVKNQEGILEEWKIRHGAPDKSRQRTVWRLTRNVFLQQLQKENPQVFTERILSGNQRFALIIIENDYAEDSVLLLLGLDSRSSGTKKFPELSIVVGWENPEK